MALFFTLSGFLITHRYFIQPEAKPGSLFQYFIRRAARIYPLYYTLLAAYFLFGQNTVLSPETFIPLTLGQAWFFTTRYNYISTAWSLTVEEAFYFIAPFFFYVSFMVINARPVFRRHPLRITLFLLVLLNIALPLLGQLLLHLSVTFGLNQPFDFMYTSVPFPYFFCFTIFYRIFDFSTGIVCAYVCQRFATLSWPEISRQRAATGLMLVGIVGFIASGWFMNQNGGAFSVTGFVFDYSASLSVGLFIIALTVPGTILYQLLSHSLLVYLGRISFALYLLQLSAPFSQLYARFFIHFQTTAPVEFLLRYLFMSALAVIFYETVEKYGGRFINALGCSITERRWYGRDSQPVPKTS